MFEKIRTKWVATHFKYYWLFNNPPVHRPRRNYEGGIDRPDPGEGAIRNRQLGRRLPDTEDGVQVRRVKPKGKWSSYNIVNIRY